MRVFENRVFVILFVPKKYEVESRVDKITQDLI